MLNSAALCLALACALLGAAAGQDLLVLQRCGVGSSSGAAIWVARRPEVPGRPPQLLLPLAPDPARRRRSRRFPPQAVAAHGMRRRRSLHTRLQVSAAWKGNGM